MLNFREKEILEKYKEPQIIQENDYRILRCLGAIGMVEWGYMIYNNQAEPIAKTSSRGRKLLKTTRRKEKTKHSFINKVIAFIGEYGGV